MSIARSVADVLRDHVVLELEAIDRMYLNVYVPHLQTVGAVVGYLHVHHGQRFASTSAVVPMTEAFLRKIEQFVDDEGVDLVAFEKNQRKDNVTQKYLRGFRKTEGVLYVGKAQEKARVVRTQRRRNRRTGASYPWIVESTAMVNHLYEAPRVKRLFVINIFSSSLLVSRGSRERGSALMAWQSPCLAALSGQPPEPGGSRRKARGVDGESACQATMMSPGHYAANVNCVLRCC